MSDRQNDKPNPNICPKCGIESHSGSQYCMTCGLDFKTAARLARKIKSRERPFTLIETVVGLLMLVALIGGGVSTLHDWIKERSARRESVHASYSSSKIEGHYAWNGGLQEDYKFPQIMTLEFRKDGTFTQTTVLGGECPGKYEIDRSGIIVIGFDDPADYPGGKGFRMLTRAGDALIDEDGKRWEKQ